jgi:cysteine desulfurase/selenocysteine lyase
MTAHAVLATPPALDVAALRADFPTLRRTINGHPLVYLDNAATSQKPQVVIDRMNRFYTEEYSTVRRSIHLLSAKATQAYEQTRHLVAQLINAPEARQIIFTKGTTEGSSLAPGTRSSFRPPSTTPTSSRGRCCVRKKAHTCGLSPWMIGAN